VLNKNQATVKTIVTTIKIKWSLKNKIPSIIELAGS
jgi:hypothetical protein